MSSRLTDKEAKLLTSSMANVNGGAKAIMHLIDFSKVFGPAGYKDVGNAKVMFIRLMNKIVDDGIEGTPGRSNKSGPKVKKGSKADNEGMDSSPSTEVTPIKPTKKRLIASEFLEDEDTPTKRVRVASKGSKGATADGENVFSGDNGASGSETAGFGLKKKPTKRVRVAPKEPKGATTDGEEVLSGNKGMGGLEAAGAKIVKKSKEVVLSASEEEEAL